MAHFEGFPTQIKRNGKKDLERAATSSSFLLTNTYHLSLKFRRRRPQIETLHSKDFFIIFDLNSSHGIPSKLFLNTYISQSRSLEIYC